MKKFLSHRLTLVLLSATLAVTLVSAGRDYLGVGRQMEIFADLFKAVNLYYVDDTDPKKLIDTAIGEMLTSLDPYTVFMDTTQVEDFKVQTTGEYGGIGALIRSADSSIYVSEPYAGTPSHTAGLKAGDKFLQIDGKNVQGLNVEEVTKLLKGASHTEVNIKYQRWGEKKPSTVKFLRQTINLPSVPMYELLDEGTGYIPVTTFSQKTGADVTEAFLNLKKQGMTSLILDLRGNGGGLLSQAVEVCNIFLPKGTEVVSTRGRSQAFYESLKTLHDPVDTLMPIVVLVDGGTASAAEIVGGTIQDLDRGVVVGTRTFGKGLVQQTMPLSYDTELKITIAKYYTPSGRCIQAIDYEGRDRDGMVHSVPDSLKKAFKTKNGRTVYDGGGIAPDVEIESLKVPYALAALQASKELFFFVNDWVSTHAQDVSAPEKFTLSEQDYNAFIDYLQKNRFTYRTFTERGLSEVEKMLEYDGLSDSLAQDIEALRQQVKAQKMENLKKYRQEITRILSQEIVTRYHDQQGLYRFMTRNDRAIEKAQFLLSDPAQYGGLLKTNSQTNSK